MINRTLARGTTSLAAIGISFACAGAALAQVSFERVAPENSVFVMGLHNATATEARFKRTSLHELWRSDELRDLRRTWTEEMERDLDEAMREAGVDREDLSWPTGAVGFAFFPVIDPERGMPEPAFILFADYGERADRIERAISAAIDRGQREDALEVEDRDILGRTVRSLTFQNGDENDDWGDDDWGFDDMGPGFGAGDPAEGFRTIHLVRDGGAFFLCNDLGSVTELLDRIDNDRPSGLGERADFRAAMDQLGSNDAYAVLLTRDLMQLASVFDPTGMAMMVPPMLRSLFGEIQAISTSVLLDAPEAMIRQNMAMYMPAGKRGLTSLMDVATPRAPLPAFVGADAYSYTAINFAFNQLADAAQQFVQANPMLQMFEVGDMLAQVDPMVRELTATLGSSLHMVNSLTRPIEADSSHTVLAVESTDTQRFETMFAQLAANMGLEGRDFLDHRIYATDPMMMGAMPGMPAPEFAVGIGAGHVFMGGAAAVEQALRSASERNDRGALAEDSQYRRAVGLIPDTPLVTWGYADLVTTIEATIRVGQAAGREMMEQMREQFPEWAEEMEEDAEDDPFRNINYDLLRRHIGPSVSWMTSTDTGFVGTTLYLSATETEE